MNNSGKKSKLIAGLLCWFLGFFGAHRFYLGHKRSGFVMVLLSILGFAGSGLLAAAASQRRPDEVLLILGGVLTMCLTVVGIWVLVDLVRIVTGQLAPAEGYGASMLASKVEQPKIHEAFADAAAGMIVLEKYYKLYRKGALSKSDYKETAAEFLSRM